MHLVSDQGGALKVCAHVRRRVVPSTLNAAQVSPVHYQNSIFDNPTNTNNTPTIILCEEDNGRIVQHYQEYWKPK